MKRKSVVIVCLLVVGNIVAIAQEKRRDEPISDELYGIVYARADAIKSELASSSSNEWAGTYMDGDHHPTVFTWAPNSGYLVTSSLHTFSPPWVNYGKVKLESNLFTIFPELTKGQKSAHILPTEFVPVVWDNWHFLVSADSLLEFAYAVHSKSESQIWNFFAKASDIEKPRKGLPNLPAQYRRIMTMPAITVRIVKIGKESEDFWRTTITIDAGSRKGIVSGMQLYYRAKGVEVSIRVTDVGERTSIANVSMFGGDSNDEIRPKIGWKFSSKIPKRFIEPG